MGKYKKTRICRVPNIFCPIFDSLSIKCCNFAAENQHTFMSLHNKEDHTGCVYHATDESALFRQYRLSEGTDISAINKSRSALLYLAEGRLQIASGNSTPSTLAPGVLVFLPKNTGFTGETLGSCHFIVSFFTGQLPLCNKRNLVDPQHPVRPRSGKPSLLPPPENSHN